MLRRHLNRLVVAAAAAAALPGAAAHAAQIAPPPGQLVPSVAPLVASYGGVIAWSERESLGGRETYALTASLSGTHVRLPVASRPTPFDVSAGPDRAGRPVLVYSRCAREPGYPQFAIASDIFSAPAPVHTTGGGCDIYRFDVTTMRESKVTGASTRSASEILPTIWQDDVAFARVYERRSGRRGLYPYLYIRTVAGRTTRRPGGPRGKTGLPGPTSLSLNNGRLAFVWNSTANGRHRGGLTTVRLDLPSGRSRVVARTQFRRDFDHYASYVSPTIAGDTVTFGLQKVSLFTGGARPPRSTGASFIRYRISSRRIVRQPAPAFLASVATAGDALIYGTSSDGEGWLGAVGTVHRLP